MIKELARSKYFYWLLQFVRTIKNKLIWSQQDQDKLVFYQQFISDGDVVYDVGANIGNRTKIFSRLASKVIAFEPQESCARILRNNFTGDSKVVIVQKALGAECGSENLLLSNANTISSISQNWIDKVKKSGRFSDFQWNKKEKVEVTTLDSMIAEFGRPTFIKIDVVGFEYEVIQGLSERINNISIEFTPEYIDSTLASLNFLGNIYDYRANFIMNDNMKFELDNFGSIQNVIDELLNYKNDSKLFGEVFLKV